MDVAQMLIAIVGLGASVTTYCLMRFPHMCREASGRMQPAQSSFPVLHRLWGQQASPGLYTWHTVLSVKDEVADGWQYAQGWHNELAVTPDYEPAALLLLLQQDMLEYLDDQAAEPTVVIGAGLTGA